MQPWEIPRIKSTEGHGFPYSGQRLQAPHPYLQIQWEKHQEHPGYSGYGDS